MVTGRINSLGALCPGFSRLLREFEKCDLMNGNEPNKHHEDKMTYFRRISLTIFKTFLIIWQIIHFS